MVFLSGGVARQTPIEAYGSSSPIISGNLLEGPNVGLNLLARHATYGEIYRRHLWVAVLVNKLAWGTARLPFKVYKRTETSRDDARDTPFGRLMANPNPKMDRFALWLWTSSTYDVYGEAMWIKIRPRDGAPPKYLYPLHPTAVDIERNEQGEVVYKSRLNRDLSWPESDIVHFRTYNPGSASRGLSRLEPLRATLMNEDAIVRAQQAFWTNGARPSVILTHPKELRGGAAERIKTSWNAAHSGIDSWSKAAVLEEGMTAQIVQLSAEEMQMIESRKANREEACALYDVPPPVVHVLDRATFSNITEQMRSMYRDTQAPRLGMFEAAIEHQLLPEFGDDTLYGEFLLDEVLRGAFEQRTEAYQKAINSGWMKPKEVRDLENLPDAGPSADRLYINGAAIPLEAAGTDAGTPAPGPDAAPVEVLRTVAGRLSRASSPQDVDVASLIRGLPEDSTNVVLAHLNAALSRGDDIATLRRSLAAALTEGDQE